MKQTKEEIFNELKRFAIEIIGAEFISDEEISPDNTFSKTLEMDSIEIVAFFEKVKKTYGEDVNFQKWLSQKDLKEIINLKISDVVNYIEQCQK